MKKIDIEEFAKNIETRQDFETFMKLLLKELKEDPESWENQNLLSYIDGMYGFVLGISGYYQNVHRTEVPETPTWGMFARILMAARVYE